MLGVCLRKLCPQDSFGYAFRKKKTVRNSTPGGCLREASGRLFGASWAQLGPCVPQLVPSRPFFGPTRRPRGLPGRFWNDFGPLWEALEGQKHCKIQRFCCVSRSATDIVQIVQISPWKSQNDPQEAPRSGQGRPRRPSRRLEERDKRPKSAPRTAETRLPSGLGGQVGHNWHKRAVRTPPPRAGVALSGGRFSDSFLLSESIAKALLWAKLAQAYAQHR